VSAAAEVNVVGVPDRGLDPSVVAITGRAGALCSGVLVASDAVLTARHCVIDDPSLAPCPASSPLTDPTTLHVYTEAPGPSVAWVSVGASILTPDDPGVCGADLAVLILEQPVAGVPASFVSESGIAVGSYVRTVGFGWRPGSAVGEVMREHMPVLDVSSSELAVGEATCVGSGGSVAFDESTGQVVGVLARWGTLCGAAQEFDVFTRADAFYGLVKQALAWAPSLAELPGPTDGGIPLVDAGRTRDAGHTKKPLTDVGAACSAPADCGTGVCITAEGSQYCSRACSPFDTCPSTFKCVIASGGGSVCVQT
jgi:hypothetical protein